MKQVEECLHEVIGLNGTPGNANDRNTRARSPLPAQIIGEPHASRRIALHRMNTAVGCAGSSSHDGPRFGGQAIDPIAREDRLAGFSISPK